jgi:hypothetical protein
MRWRGCAAAVVALLGCHSDDAATGTAPADSQAGKTTTIVVSEPLDAAPPECAIHLTSPSFSSDHATLAGMVRVDGDYTRTLANVTITDRPNGPPWAGTFNGTRDAFLQMLRGHVCTESHVYALKPGDANDPSKGPVMLTAFEMKPDEKHDVDALCNATSHAPDAATNPELRDHFIMQWVEDSITTMKWDAWRRSFARERTALFTQKQDPSALFHTRATDLAAAASALGLQCPTAVEWKKR